MNHFDKATADAMENIKKFDNTLNPYASLAAGESKEWYFNPNSIEKVPNRFSPNDPNQERIRFKIWDPEKEWEFMWDASMGAARQVIAEMKKQNFFLKVSRTGEGKETRYSVTPVETGSEPPEMKTSDESGGELE